MDAEKKMGLKILRNENITNIFIRKFIGLGIVFLMLLIMNSCGGDDDPIEPDTPTVSEIVLADKSQSTLEFDAGASTQTVRFSTTQAWSAEVSSGDWCTVSPASGSAGNGSITVSVSENTEEAERSATVTLKAGEASQTLEVTQSLSSFDVEKVAGYITEVTETVDDLFMQSDGMAELSQSVEEIRSLDGVQNVSATDNVLYVEIKDGGIMSWYYSPKLESTDVNATTDLLPKSFQTSMVLTKGLASDHEFIEPKKFCIINQTVNDEEMGSIASNLTTLKNTLDDVFDIDFIRGEAANLDFFSTLTNYDCIYIETHGGYFDNQHWLATGEVVNDEPRQWLKSDAGRQWRNKSIDIMTVEEIRKSKAVETAYWAISEKFIESIPGSFNNSIIFSDACQSLMGNNTLALAFQKKGAGVYLGYDNDNSVGYKAGKAFWENLSLGMTVEQAFGNIPDEYKNDSEWGGVLHFYPQSNGNMCIVHPEVNTSDATNIGGTTATLQGEITGWIESLNADEAEAGFCWGKSLNPLVEDGQVKSQNVSKYRKTENTISLSEDIVELEPNATYYYRAFLKMNGEYYYGDVKEFETAEQEDDGMRAYLVKLYHDTDGDNWDRNDNWLSDKPITEWYGIGYYVDNISEDCYDFKLPREGYTINLRNNNLNGVVDLSGCPYILTLDIDGNKFTSVDVSDCTSLTRMEVANDYLTKLDISGTALTSLECTKWRTPSLNTIIAEHSKLWNLKCNQIPLEELRISGGSIRSTPGIPEAHGLQVDIYSAPIKKLDLSGCSSKLGLLRLRDVQLSELNVSGSAMLTTLTCNYVEIENVDVSDCLVLDILSFENSSVTSLDASGCNGLEYMMSYFLQNFSLSNLNLSNCMNLQTLNCDEWSLKELNVSNCPILSEIDCSDNLLESINVSGCVSLKELNCGDNLLETIDVSGCPKLESLYCANNNITKEIPVDFKKLSRFGHDVRYKYFGTYWDSEKEQYVVRYTDNEVGWWYPGEPESGKHAWPDE